MFKKIQLFLFGPLDKNQLNDVNELLKKVFNDNATMKVNFLGGNRYDAIIDHGIKGPLNIEYLNIKLNKIFQNINFISRFDKMPLNEKIFVIEVQNTSSKNHNYSIIIKNIPVEYFSYQIPESLKAFLNSSNEDNEEEEFASEIRSGFCYSTLSTNGLTKKHTRWTKKIKGDAPGLTLYYPGKQGEKRVFVKEIEVDEWLNYSILSIAKNCGVKSPKTKIEFAQINYYLFSSDLNRLKNKTIYQYKDFSEYFSDVNSFIDFKQLRLFTGRNDAGAFSHYFSIDKISIARFFLMSMIFGLTDLHQDNVGLVVSKKEDTAKAKMAFIDCQIDPDKRLDSSLLEGSIAHSVKSYLQINSLISEKFLIQLLEEVSDEDYVEAFKKIEANFQESFQDQKEKNDEIFNKLYQFISHNDFQKQKLETMRAVFLETWLKNFSMLQEKINFMPTMTFS